MTIDLPNDPKVLTNVAGGKCPISLTHGHVAWVDDEDYFYLSRFVWHAFIVKSCRTVYARTSVSVEGRRYHVLMHVLIMEAPGVDHRDGNGLNNCRRNLRMATKAQNNRNTRLPVTNSSSYKGVHWCARINKWVAQINVNGRRRHLGCFKEACDAATAYNFAAQEHYGEFARYNQ